MLVEIWPIDRLKPYPKNARKIPAKAIEKVAQSLAEFGWRQPIVVDTEGVIVAGHTRWYAAQKVHMTECPVHVATGLTPEQIRAYRLMDNRSNQESSWDLDILSMEMLDLKALKLDLSLTGFDGRELDSLLFTRDEREDTAPAIPEDPVTQTGDLWILGDHRLLCGDSTNAADVLLACVDLKPFLMVTDPPYGVEYDPENARDTNVAIGRPRNDHIADWRQAWALFHGSVAYVWHAGLRARPVVESLEAAGFTCRAQIIWDKTRVVMSRGHYHFQHEPCWYAVRNGATAHWSGDRKQSTIWAIPHLRSETGHSNQKPVECMRRPILNHTVAGDWVYEPFSGSGSTIIACETTDRRCIAIELEPAYVDVAVMRWQNFTGQEAKLETGETFSHVKESRQGVAQ